MSTSVLVLHWVLHPLFPKLPDGSRDLEKEWTYIDTWKMMEKLLDTGKVRAIGVCNCSVKYLEDLLPHARAEERTLYRAARRSPGISPRRWDGRARRSAPTAWKAMSPEPRSRAPWRGPPTPAP